MSDLIEVAGGSSTAKIGDKEYIFLQLTNYDKARILREAKDARKKQLMENAKLAGLPPEQIYSELENHQDQSYGQNQWVDMANDPADGQLIILAASLDKSYAGEGQKIVQGITLHSSKQLHLVAYVAGLTITAPEPIDEEAGADVPPADRYATPV